jgi:hypothetical protein
VRAEKRVKKLAPSARVPVKKLASSAMVPVLTNPALDRPCKETADEISMARSKVQPTAVVALAKVQLSMLDAGQAKKAAIPSASKPGGIMQVAGHFDLLQGRARAPPTKAKRAPRRRTPLFGLRTSVKTSVPKKSVFKKSAPRDAADMTADIAADITADSLPRAEEG